MASLAAGFLLMLLGGLFWRSRETAPPAEGRRDPAAAVLVGSEAIVGASGSELVAGSLLELMVGSAGQVAMAPGSRGCLDGSGSFRLEEGSAWVEAAGEPLRIALAGWDGTLELQDAEVLVHAGPAPVVRASLFLGTAWGEEGAWGITVLRGEALVRAGAETRRLTAGQALGVPAAIQDPRGWTCVPGGPWSVRDGLQAFLPSSQTGLGLPCVAEIVLRKKDSAAEAALLFEAGGRTWQVPLGVHLPMARSWLRLRLELGGDRVRVLAGDTEILRCAAGALASFSYPVPEKAAWGLKAWGGDVEVREARWRAGAR
jgi:hypothetical protein